MDWQRVPQAWSSSRKTPVAETVIMNVGRRTSLCLSPDTAGFSTFIGCQCYAESSTSWLSWYSSRCRAKPHRVWRWNVRSSPTTLSLPSSFCRGQRLHRPENEYPIGRQKFLCRWTTSFEQSTQHSATA